MEAENINYRHHFLLTSNPSSLNSLPWWFPCGREFHSSLKLSQGIGSLVIQPPHFKQNCWSRGSKCLSKVSLVVCCYLSSFHTLNLFPLPTASLFCSSSLAPFNVHFFLFFDSLAEWASPSPLFPVYYYLLKYSAFVSLTSFSGPFDSFTSEEAGKASWLSRRPAVVCGHACEAEDPEVSAAAPGVFSFSPPTATLTLLPPFFLFLSWHVIYFPLATISSIANLHATLSLLPPLFNLTPVPRHAHALHMQGAAARVHPIRRLQHDQGIGCDANACLMVPGPQFKKHWLSRFFGFPWVKLVCKTDCSWCQFCNVHWCSCYVLASESCRFLKGF